MIAANTTISGYQHHPHHQGLPQEPTPHYSDNPQIKISCTNHGDKFMDLQKVTPIIPKYPKQKLPKDHFQRMITIRFDRLQMQLNDLKLLITECLEQE